MSRTLAALLAATVCVGTAAAPGAVALGNIAVTQSSGGSSAAAAQASSSV